MKWMIGMSSSLIAATSAHALIGLRAEATASVGRPKTGYGWTSTANLIRCERRHFAGIKGHTEVPRQCRKRERRSVILSYSRPLRLALPVGGIVLSGALSIAAYTARSLNTPRRKSEMDGFTFTPWEVQVPYESVEFVTEDGVTIRGWWFPRQESNQVVVGCTGHKGVKSDLLGIGSGLWRAGNNVLLFDFRGCGESDAASPSLAHNELPDARAAVLYAQRRLPGARLGLIGYSMGAAVAILVAATDSSIRAVVADSSFLGMREVVGHAFTRFRLPPLPMLGLTDTVNRWRYGYRFAAVRPLDVVRRVSPRPILLIHGEDDRIVPVEHARHLYDVAGESKELWITAGTPHCGTYFDNREHYVRKVSDFFDRGLQ